MADIIQFGHQEKPGSDFRQIIVNSVLQILGGECGKMLNRIVSDIEREESFDFEASEFYIRDEMHRIGAVILERM